jgi:hypothetical protein
MKSVVLAFCIFQLTVLPAKYHIKKIWLFSRTAYAGNVPKRPDGKLATGYTNTLLCFLEISKTEPTADWQTACFEGSKYEVSILQPNSDSVRIGTEKHTKKNIFIKASTGFKLVQLMMTLTEKDRADKCEGFILKGKLNDKHTCLKTNEPVIELSPVFRP